MEKKLANVLEILLQELAWRLDYHSDGESLEEEELICYERAKETLDEYKKLGHVCKFDKCPLKRKIKNFLYF